MAAGMHLIIEGGDLMDTEELSFWIATEIESIKPEPIEEKPLTLFNWIVIGLAINLG